MDNQGYRIKQVAEVTGLTPQLIRIWERRYRFLASQRAPNGYRLSSEKDLRLRLYQNSRIKHGNAISDVARLGLTKLKEGMTQGPMSIPEVSSDLLPLPMGILGIGEAGATLCTMPSTSDKIKGEVLRVTLPPNSLRCPVPQKNRRRTSLTEGVRNSGHLVFTQRTTTEQCLV